MSRPSEAWVRAVGVSLPRAYPKWTPLQIHPELRLWVSLASPRSDWRAAAMDMLVGQCCNTANGSLQKTRNFNKALTIHKVKSPARPAQTDRKCQIKSRHASPK
jgi:hypothetical protein